MLSRDRVIATLNREDTDRIPVTPQVLEHAVRLAGMRVSDVFSSSEKFAKAQLDALEKYKYDGVWAGVVDMYNLLPEALGCQIVVPEDGIPDIKAPIVKQAKDIDKLFIPDPYKDARLPVALECIQLLRKEVGDEAAVMTGLAGPFAIAGNLRGVTQIMLDVQSNQNLVKELCEITTKACARYGQAILDSGADVLFLVDALAAPALVGPNVWNQIIFPYHQKLAKKLHQKPIIYHTDVGVHLVWDNASKLDVDAIEPEDTEDIGKLREMIGEDTVLAGVVGPIPLRSESPEKLKHRVKQIIKQGSSRKGRLIFFTGMVPLDTPFENLKTVVDSVKQFNIQSKRM
jgi:uroporphyrinogen decarboxylase